MFEDVLKWAPSILGPSQLLPLQASCRLLSVGIVDHAKHREPSGKKPLSEKKLVSHCLGRMPLSLPHPHPKRRQCQCVRVHMRVCTHGSQGTG